MQKFCSLTYRLDAKILHSHFKLNSLQNQHQKMDHAEILHFNLEIQMQKFCIAIFPLNSLKNQQQIDNAEILHFYFDTCKIWMQKFCRAIFPLNSLKDQQQMDNAEILHFNFEKYKISMQKFCRASFGQIHYKNNITKLVSKCAGGKTKSY